MQYDRHFSAGPEGKEINLFQSLLKQDWHRSQRADTSTQTSQEQDQVLRGIFSDSGGHACSCCCDTTLKAAWGEEGLLGSQTHPQGKSVRTPEQELKGDHRGLLLTGLFQNPFLTPLPRTCTGLYHPSRLGPSISINNQENCSHVSLMEEVL